MPIPLKLHGHKVVAPLEGDSMSTELRAGDVVTLRSTSRPMTVASIDGDVRSSTQLAKVFWWNEQTLTINKDLLPVASLVKAEEAPVMGKQIHSEKLK